MPSTLNVTKTLSNSKWVITATISSGGILPLEIFVYENTGTTQLGSYQGVVAAVDMPRIQIFTGTVLPIFGNKFVRFGTGTLYVNLDSNPDDAIARLKSSVQILSTTYQSLQNISQVYTIT
jgi:hypothetical protein